MSEPDSFLELAAAAARVGLRLEYAPGRGFTAEAMPSRRHQQAVQRIEQSIRAREPGCTCVHLPDVLVRFPDGAYKRPDISIWTREPDELDTAVTLVPAAVVEVISKGYEHKDLVGAPEWYLSQGVLDVVVLDPVKGQVLHFYARDRWRESRSPTLIQLACGCDVTV